MFSRRNEAESAFKSGSAMFSTRNCNPCRWDCGTSRRALTSSARFVSALFSACSAASDHQQLVDTVSAAAQRLEAAIMSQTDMEIDTYRMYDPYRLRNGENDSIAAHPNFPQRAWIFRQALRQLESKALEACAIRSICRRPASTFAASLKKRNRAQPSFPIPGEGEEVVEAASEPVPHAIFGNPRH